MQPHDNTVSRRKLFLAASAATVGTVLLPKLGWAAIPERAEAVPLPRLNPGHRITAFSNGLLLVTGGILGKGPRARAVTTALILDPSTGNSYFAAPMNTGRAYHAALALPGDQILVLGGKSPANLSSVEIYDPYTNVWSYRTPLESLSGELEAALTRGTVFVTSQTGGGTTYNLNLREIAIQP